MASWAEHAIWWHVYPLGFTNADDAGILVLLNAGDDPFRFPVDVTGLAVAGTPDPGARPGDPALVPAHSWVILGS